MQRISPSATQKPAKAYEETIRALCRDPLRFPLYVSESHPEFVLEPVDVRFSRRFSREIFAKTSDHIVDWASINKTDYLQAIERSPINTLELRVLLADNLTADTSLETCIKGVEASYAYEMST